MHLYKYVCVFMPYSHKGWHPIYMTYTTHNTLTYSILTTIRRGTIAKRNRKRHWNEFAVVVACIVCVCVSVFLYFLLFWFVLYFNCMFFVYDRTVFVLFEIWIRFRSPWHVCLVAWHALSNCFTAWKC